MVATARWFSMFWKYNMLIHTIIGNIIMAVTYYYCLRALNKAEFAFEFDKIHNILGYILTIAIGFITGSGAVARYQQLWGEWSNKFFVIAKRIHKYLALIIFVVSIFANTSGWRHWSEFHDDHGAWIKENHPQGKYYYISNINIILSFVISIMCEVYYRWVRDYKIIKLEMNCKPGAQVIMTEK